MNQNESFEKRIGKIVKKTDISELEELSKKKGNGFTTIKPNTIIVAAGAIVIGGLTLVYYINQPDDAGINDGTKNPKHYDAPADPDNRRPPENRTTNTYSNAQKLYERGYELEKQWKKLEAIKEYKKIIELDTKYEEAFWRISAAYRDLYFWHESYYVDNPIPKSEVRQFKKWTYKYLDEALRINPFFPEAYYQLGLLEHDKQRYSSAIKNYTKAIELDSRFHEAYYQRGLAYEYSGDRSLARIDFEKSIDLMNNARIVKYDLTDPEGAQYGVDKLRPLKR